MSIINPSQARKVLYQLLKDVNKTNEPIYISGKNEDSEAVMISKKDWNAIQETLYLQSSGVADVVQQREKKWVCCIGGYRLGYFIKLAKYATKDLKNLKSAYLDKKFKELMILLQNNPFQNPLPYEKLIENLKDKYSRRLNIQHRIVYSVDNNIKEIIIWSVWTHYER